LIGKIEQITEDNYILTPTVNISSNIYDKLNIVDPTETGGTITVPINHDIKNISYTDRQCFDDNFNIYNFDQDIYSKETFRELLYDIIPNSKKIIDSYKEELDECLNYNEINEVLRRYNLEINNLTNENAQP
jgi:hypothetical protein